MIPEILSRKLRGKRGCIVLEEKRPFRVEITEDNRSVVYACSSPIIRDGKLNTRGFLSNTKTLYRGVNVQLWWDARGLNLHGGSETLTFFLRKEKNDAHKNNETNLGYICPTINGFALKGKSNVELEFQTNTTMYLINMEDYCQLFRPDDSIAYSINAFWEGMQERPNFYIESDSRNHKIKVRSPRGEPIVLSINAYVNKSIFDTSIDSVQVHRNNVYAEMVYLGGENEQWLCLRPNCDIFSDLYDCEVEQAIMYFRNLNGGKGELEYGMMQFLWCSFTTAWESREEPEVFYKASKLHNNYYELDVTRLFKHLFQEKSQVTPGIVIRSHSKQMVALPTGDNYTYPIVTKLIIKK